jgi:hypothetical protein
MGMQKLPLGKGSAKLVTVKYPRERADFFDFAFSATAGLLVTAADEIRNATRTS